MAVWTHEPNENLLGRHLGAPIVDESTGEVVFDRDTLIDAAARDGILDVLQRSKDTDPMVPVRSVLKCDSEFGVCQKLLRHQPGQQREAEIGDAVGHIAAQSIGEPGHPAHHAHLPHRRRGRRRHHPRPAARGRALRGAQAQGRGAHRRGRGPRARSRTRERGRKLTVTPDDGRGQGVPVRARRTHVLVENGDWVEEGAPLTPGSLYPADLLRVRRRHGAPSATS